LRRFSDNKANFATNVTVRTAILDCNDTVSIVSPLAGSQSDCLRRENAVGTRKYPGNHLHFLNNDLDESRSNLREEVRLDDYSTFFESLSCLEQFFQIVQKRIERDLNRLHPNRTSSLCLSIFYLLLLWLSQLRLSRTGSESTRFPRKDEKLARFLDSRVFAFRCQLWELTRHELTPKLASPSIVKLYISRYYVCTFSASGYCTHGVIKR